MAVIATPPKLQFFDANGAPLVGGKLYSYAAGTTTPLATFTDAGGVTPNANPIILDSRGEASVWLGTALYKFRLTTSTDVDVWTVDNVGGFATLAQLAASGGSASIGFLPSGVGAVATTVQAKLRQSVSVFDFMTASEIADVQAGTLSLDCTTAVQAAIAASKNIYFPPGKYRFNSTLTITGARGLTLYGAAAAILAAGTGYTGTTELYFSNASSGSDGLVFTDFLGVSISDMTIVMRRGGVGGGKALYLYNGHDYSLENVKIDVLVGAAGYGVQLGNGNGATSTFAGDIRNVKVMSNGALGIYANFGTSLTFTACYVIGGWMQFDGMVYSSVISCAVDASTQYGYVVYGCSNMVFSACGCERAEKGAFFVTTTAANIVFDAPYGAANNVSADPTIGDLFQLDSSTGAVGSITITNPTSVAPNAATAQNIWATAGTGFVEVYNTNSIFFTKGINGNITWKETKLTVTGYLGSSVPQTWTPTLTGWTNVGAPTVTAKYAKQGSMLMFYIRIVPGTSISCTKSTSTITNFPIASIALGAGSATMYDDNLNSYGVCAIGPTGIVYPQTSGVLTVALNINGTILIP